MGDATLMADGKSDLLAKRSALFSIKVIDPQIEQTYPVIRKLVQKFVELRLEIGSQSFV